MELQHLSQQPEAATLDEGTFSALQAQLAAQGVELHRVTGATGREAFTLNLQGQVRTLDTLPQVSAYVRRLGLPLSVQAPGQGLQFGPTC